MSQNVSRPASAWQCVAIENQGQLRVNQLTPDAHMVSRRRGPPHDYPREHVPPQSHGAAPRAAKIFTNPRDKFSSLPGKTWQTAMSESPPTRQTLLLRLGDPSDRRAWEQFVEIYAPLVFQFARRRGLQDSDAADLVQDVLLRVAGAFRRGTYDRSRGKFRGWLLTIARHETYDWLAARARREQAGGGTAALQQLSEIPQPGEAEAWEDDYCERLLAWAAEQVQKEVQPATWRAFRLTAVERQSGEQAAAQLGLSVAAVYLAKSRVMKRLRELVSEIDEEAIDAPLTNDK
jgi:RNA polymerase sigma-70 factor (ECF subfamily)